MNYELSYLGRSAVVWESGSASMRFSPNLGRDRVSFDGEVKSPVRYREAMSALHEVVVGDLRFKKRDRTAYREWLESEERRLDAVQAQVARETKEKELAKLGRNAPPADLDAQFQKMHRLYWDARVRWANELAQNDPELFRHLVPCDPVVTVAPDVVFFECFSKDESSYGCLFVERDAFRGAGDAAIGTTNVDYSLALYDQFQTLRTYRPTRLVVDPAGFGVEVQGAGEHREEKIDLPSSWLRGFAQISAATLLPTTRVSLSVESIYSVLAHLKRHREKTGPRSLRFKLVPGEAPRIVLDPWQVEIVSRGTVYAGDKPQEVKVWGRRRLMSLARTLPLADRVDVELLGSGMPSIWTVPMGDMRFVLATSGWTTNDWTAGAALDVLAGNFRHDARTVAALTVHLQKVRSATVNDLAVQTGAPNELLLGSLLRLAREGQVVYDFAARKYRWRSILSMPLGESALGPEHPEIAEGRRLVSRARIEQSEILTGGRTLESGKVEGTACEIILDVDGRLTKAKCSCSWFHKNGLRGTPCRHVVAMRLGRSAEMPTAMRVLH